MPEASHYEDFSLFEDGIGMMRSTIDDWRRAEGEGTIAACAKALRSQGAVARMVVGCAQRPFLDPLIAESGIADVFCPLYVENRFFGGNVDVTGLLVGEDMARALSHAVEEAAGSAEAPHCQDASGKTPRVLFLVPRVVLNDDGLLLDGMTLEDVEKAAGQPLNVVSLSPLDYFEDIIELLR